MNTLIAGAAETVITSIKAYELQLRGGYEAGPRNHALSGPYRLALLPSVEAQIHAEMTDLLASVKDS